MSSTGPAPRRAIADLDRLVAVLTPEERARFERIFALDVTVGETVPPASMHAWLRQQFGSVDAVRRQRIVKVTNRWTLEGSLFSALRAGRPEEAPPGTDDLEQAIERTAGGPFCRPAEATPADVFGRVRGKHAVTASNVAKYDGWHAVIVFDEHHPLRFSAEQVADYVDTAQVWAREAQRLDPAACYPFFMWNCLWRAGATILHGHAQMVLTRHMHLARVECWRRAALSYRRQHGADYFADVLATYRALGLAIAHGAATILPSLTPFKERETHILAGQLGSDLTGAIYRVLRTYIDRLGVRSFNLALYQPPLAPTAEDWRGFPFVVRLLDRGSLQSSASDLGAMEILGQSVVAGDPFRLARTLAGEEEP